MTGSRGMICPLCARVVPVQERDCPSCGAGLTQFAAVWYFPDLLFNEGVAALQAGQPELAASRFAQVCRLRPDDVPAREALAQVQQRLQAERAAATATATATVTPPKQEPSAVRRAHVPVKTSRASRRRAR